VKDGVNMNVKRTVPRFRADLHQSAWRRRSSTVNQHVQPAEPFDSLLDATRGLAGLADVSADAQARCPKVLHGCSDSFRRISIRGQTCNCDARASARKLDCGGRTYAPAAARD
jgi:hypothetical protein